MLVGVAGTEDAGNPFPVPDGLGGHQVILVGQGPPHVAVGGVAGNNVADVAVVILRAHAGEPPAVIGVKENQIGLDAQLLQLLNAPVQMPEVRRIEPGKIPAVALRFPGIAGEILRREHGGIHGGAFVGIGARFAQVVVVMLREDAEADFVERTAFQRLQRLADHSVLLPGPDIAGRPDGVVGLGVVIGEMPGVRHPDNAVVALPCSRDSQHTAAGLRKAAPDRIGVFPLKGGHEAHAVNAVAVVKAGNGHMLAGAGEFSVHALLGKGVAPRGPLHAHLPYAPAFNALRAGKLPPLFHAMLSSSIILSRCQG